VSRLRALFRRSPREAAVRLLLRYAPGERRRVFLLTIVVGALGGLAAVLFHLAIQALGVRLIGRALDTPGPIGTAAVLLVPALGALAGGVLLYRFFPDSRGSGIPQVKVAYAIHGGRMPVRVVVGKFLTSTLQIGTGSSLGREGPTVQICAGIASQLGQWFALSRRSLASLLPVGTAAGIAAAFNAPIAAVTFAIEEIVGDIDQAVLAGVVVAAAIAAAIERGILGAHPVLETVVPLGSQPLLSLPIYLVLGVVAAVASVAFTDALLGLRHRFQRMDAIPPWVRPAVGGLVTGALALAALRLLGQRGVAGVGYDTLSLALAGRLALLALVGLAVLKLVATAFSYGSGGAGGIFAPALFIGGMLGGAVGHLDVAVLGHAHAQVAAFALVGMGAVLAGIVRAPITSVLIIFEMTDGYALILPLMIANMTAYGLARRWRPTPVYEALLEQDGVHLPGRATDLGKAIENLRVSAAMTTNVVRIAADWTVREAAEHVAIHDFAAYPVVEADGRFAGLIGQARLRRALAREQGDLRVGELVWEGGIVRPDQRLVQAVVLMNRLGERQLPVVREEDGARLVGIVTMGDIVRAQADAALSIDSSLAPDFGEAREILRRRD
jgi:CIC family chloride channel protein